MVLMEELQHQQQDHKATLLTMHKDLMEILLQELQVQVLIQIIAQQLSMVLMEELQHQQQGHKVTLLTMHKDLMEILLQEQLKVQVQVQHKAFHKVKYHQDKKIYIY